MSPYDIDCYCPPPLDKNPVWSRVTMWDGYPKEESSWTASEEITTAAISYIAEYLL